MFGFLKSKRNDPDAIATAILRVADDPEHRARCFDSFEFSPEQLPKANLAVLSFVFSAATFWATIENDGKNSEAFEKASYLIPRRLKDAGKFVRAGDYLCSSFELTKFPFVLEETFKQRVPVPENALSDTENFTAMLHASARRYELLFETLVSVTLQMRLEAFFKQTQFAVENNVTDVIAMYMMNAQLFTEWVTGITCLDATTELNFELNYQMRCGSGIGILIEYYQKTVKALKSL
ncbi:MAG: hypothetical protein WCR23_13590 [Planctomycetota bacterium]|jgi:hypothetical protein